MGSRRVQAQGLKDLETAAKSLTREDLLEAGARVLDMALERMSGRYTKNAERLGWARVVASVMSAASGVLRDSDLDELKVRLEKLERR